MQRNTLINKEKNPATSTEKMNKGHRQANNRRETQEATKHMAGCLKSLMVRKCKFNTPQGIIWHLLDWQQLESWVM